MSRGKTDRELSAGCSESSLAFEKDRPTKSTIDAVQEDDNILMAFSGQAEGNSP